MADIQNKKAKKTRRARQIIELGEEGMTKMTPNFDQVLAQAKALPSEEQKRLIEALSQTEAPQAAMTEEQFQAHLLREGLLSELPKPLSEREEKRDFKPINVTGAPLSETIIEERR